MDNGQPTVCFGRPPTIGPTTECSRVQTCVFFSAWVILAWCWCTGWWRQICILMPRPFYHKNAPLRVRIEWPMLSSSRWGVDFMSAQVSKWVEEDEENEVSREDRVN